MKTRQRDEHRDPIILDLPAIRATVARQGYVSGVMGGSFLDKATGARDLGFGLGIADFLLEPAPDGPPTSPDQYQFHNLEHGEIPKRYVEGPQICTQARRLDHERLDFAGYTVLRARYRWDVAYPPRSIAGSIWEETLVFHQNWRYFLAAHRVTAANESPCLFLRVDMPGHIRHERGSTFTQVYLSYREPGRISASEFNRDFPPDERFLYQKGHQPLPERFIRAYRVSAPAGGPSPWLAGMTLEPGDVHEAWCHQRGYVCMIEEIGGRRIALGKTLGACCLVGWFDDVESMNEAYDEYRGWSGIAIEGGPGEDRRIRGLTQDELTPIA